MNEFNMKKLPHADRRFGNKAANLSVLMKKGFAVPRGFAVNLGESLPLDTANKEKLKHFIEAHTKTGEVYVVRSSATVEDSPNSSFAGQFESFLNRTGTDQIIAALEKVAKSPLNTNMKAYSKKNTSDPSPIRMSMIVQRQITPIFSGVLFTKNPVT